MSETQPELCVCGSPKWRHGAVMPGFSRIDHAFEPASPIVPAASVSQCTHDHLDEDGICRKCGDDRRGSIGSIPASVSGQGPVKCGQPAAPFIPRWGMSFACVLPKGHEGEHKRGGNCFKHGEYVGEECPKWPGCIPDYATPIALQTEVPSESGQPRKRCYCIMPEPSRGRKCKRCGGHIEKVFSGTKRRSR